MGTILREYETLFVINPELADDAANAVIERLKGVLEKMNAELLREDRWGKRKLAFEVKKHGRGNYTLFHYIGPVGVVAELERTMRNLDEVIRFLTTTNGNVLDIAARKAEVEKQARERAADKAKAEAERREREERMLGGDDDGADEAAGE
ncbi:30S ribosomal protein S6 [Myxococcota bacterium]|nr:30S ribosomal protein S6 [Myxococcota bacterium]